MTEFSRHTISQTYDRIWPWLRTTPLLDIELPNSEAKPLLKLEFTQHSGSFKTRGAIAGMLELNEGAPVTAASGGNHGAAVAYAAHELGHPATIFVPENAPKTKIDLIKSYQAEVIISGENYAAALVLCEQHMAKTGAHSLHAYNDETTINGQGSVALELSEQAPETETVLVAVGGGGLIGGIAAWYGSQANIIAVEPQNCPTLNAALKANAPTKIIPSGITADALGASKIGEHAFAIAQKHITTSLLISDDEIKKAQIWLWQNCRLYVEPAAACAFAALLFEHYQPAKNERVAVILCGANSTPPPL